MNLNNSIHYGYQLANYAMEPIRWFVWGALRVFAAPSHETVATRTESIFTDALPFVHPQGNIAEFRDRISAVDFSLNNPLCESENQETILRVVLAVAIIAIPTAGTSIFYVPLITPFIQYAFVAGILGQVLHASLACLSDRTFTIIEPENASEQIANCASIASWNIGLVSAFAPLNVGTWESIVSFHWIKLLLNKLGISSTASRIENQADVIRNLGADIICFEEFFDPLQARALHEQVADIYPYARLDIGAHVWKGPSGLGVFSKIPLQNFEVHDFQTPASGFDLGTNKKFGTFDVTIQGKRTKIYTSHLNCGDNPDARHSQLQQITAHMNSELEQATEQCILLGDLNFDRTFPDAADTRFFHENFIDFLRPEEQIPYTCSNVLKYMHSISSEPEVESIDYIALYRNQDPIHARNPRITSSPQAFRVSDHLPISVDF